MVLDTFLLNTQQYKVSIKGKVEQFRERSSALPYTYWKGSLQVAFDYGCRLYFYITTSFVKDMFPKFKGDNYLLPKILV